MPTRDQPNVVEIRNQFEGGISDSDYVGIANSLPEMVGIDFISEPGKNKIHQKLTKMSGSTITEFCREGILSSNGEIYMFSVESGKIWRIKPDNSVQLCYTTVAGGGESKCLGAIEYNDYIYWFTETKVHRITKTNALTTTWSVLNLNWATFDNGDQLYHPSTIQNDVLYIGDSINIAQVDADVFSGSSIVDIQVTTGDHRITTLNNFGTGMLFGTVSSFVDCVMGLWNTWSNRIIGKDELPEEGVNCFLKYDNYSIANVGKKGNFYSFNGSIASQIKRIPGDWSGSNEAKVTSAVSRFATPMFGVSNVSGNPCPQGVYSLSKYSSGYNQVLNLDYIISTGNTSNITIGAMVLRGYDMFVAWKDENGGTSYGVDKLDHSNKLNGAYLETRILKIAPDIEKEFDLEVYYNSLPENTDIKFQYRLDGSEAWSDLTTLDDEPYKKKKHTKIKIKATSIQFKIIFTTSGNTAPEWDIIRIIY